MFLRIHFAGPFLIYLVWVMSKGALCNFIFKIFEKKRMNFGARYNIGHFCLCASVTGFGMAALKQNC